jgi:hypothetical protein
MIFMDYNEPCFLNAGSIEQSACQSLYRQEQASGERLLRSRQEPAGIRKNAGLIDRVGGAPTLFQRTTVTLDVPAAFLARFEKSRQGGFVGLVSAQFNGIDARASENFF